MDAVGNVMPIVKLVTALMEFVMVNVRLVIQAKAASTVSHKYNVNSYTNSFGSMSIALPP